MPNLYTLFCIIINWLHVIFVQAHLFLVLLLLRFPPRRFPLLRLPRLHRVPDMGHSAGVRELNIGVFGHSGKTLFVMRLRILSRERETISFLCFYHFTRPPSPLCLQPINFHFICCMTYKFYNRLQLGMYNSQFGFFLKNHRVRGNSWTITNFRYSRKPILALVKL